MTERPSAAELWPVLSEGVRDKLLAYGHKHWQQVYEDVALQNQNWIPLRSPVATRGGEVRPGRGTAAAGLLRDAGLRQPVRAQSGPGDPAAIARGGR